MAAKESSPSSNHGLRLPGRGSFATVALAVVDTVIVTLPELVKEAGLKLQEAAVGKPLQLKLTVPAAGLKFIPTT